jgi:ArsR family transcriptional regulator
MDIEKRDEEQYLLLNKKLQKDIAYYMPDNTVIERLADFFSVFSDATRIRILTALSITEMCVNDISKVLMLNQTTVSHQLRLLKGQGAVKQNRQGKIIFYSLADDKINEVMCSGVEHIGY